jgi:hypothetical protein
MKKKQEKSQSIRKMQPPTEIEYRDLCSNSLSGFCRDCFYKNSYILLLVI